MSKYDTLYLHVGWSKTGTSAIQYTIQNQKDDFLRKGILYPQSFQWSDFSHHPFALAFKGDMGAYKRELSPVDVLDKLLSELKGSHCRSVLISSELSPLYFNNKLFKETVSKNFERVKVIFTIRRQSNILISLYTQLIKDPNVRYKESLFFLAFNNLSWFNYFQVIENWSEFVGNDNIICINYGKSVVDDFFDLFEVKRKTHFQKETINVSPPPCLSCLIKELDAALPNQEFLARVNLMVNTLRETNDYVNSHLLYSSTEQRIFDEHFRQSNQLLKNVFFPDLKFTEESYASIYCVSDKK